VTGDPLAEQEGSLFLALLERVLEREPPDVVVTYGGHWLARAIREAVGRRGIPLVFWLRNLDYVRAETFAGVNGVLVPSSFVREHYRQVLGLSCITVPSPVAWQRVLCPDGQRRYLTFVNPDRDKGLFVFARIAVELARRRPDIPLLVVEGRGRADALWDTGLDLRGLVNLYVMGNTPDPRDFYRVSRALLVPSLWAEPSSRVAVEALGNGIPVLASKRGGLPETLAEAGFLFEVPDRYTRQSALVPSAAEVGPWVETVLRLWDDGAFYENERRRCLAAARAWQPERLGPAYEAFLEQVCRSASPRPVAATPADASLDDLVADQGAGLPPLARASRPHGAIRAFLTPDAMLRAPCS